MNSKGRRYGSDSIPYPDYASVRESTNYAVLISETYPEDWLKTVFRKLERIRQRCSAWYSSDLVDENVIEIGYYELSRYSVKTVYS